jgi:hypothetical protein
MKKIFKLEYIITIIILLLGIVLAMNIINIHSSTTQSRNILRKNSVNKIYNLINQYKKTYNIYPNGISASVFNDVQDTVTILSSNSRFPYYSHQYICKKVIDPQIKTNSGNNYPKCLGTSFLLPARQNIRIKTNPYSTNYFYIPIKNKTNSNIKGFILGACLEQNTIYIKSSNITLYKRLNPASILASGQKITCK